jgi:hypothetical protein
MIRLTSTMVDFLIADARAGLAPQACQRCERW